MVGAHWDTVPDTEVMMMMIMIMIMIMMMIMVVVTKYEGDQGSNVPQNFLYNHM